MKKILLLVLTLVCASSIAFAAPFSPTLLKITADAEISYDFDGSTTEIPVTISGKDASLYFLVHTKGEGANIGNVRNGYLGWHHVNKIDTCLYLSPANQFGVGATTITWDGTDNDGGVIPPGEYTYYMWAFDNMSSKEKMCHFLRTDKFRHLDMQEYDENGITMNNPLFLQTAETTTEGTVAPGWKWVIGGDPMDETLAETCNVVLGEGWLCYHTSQMVLDPTDFDYFYQAVAQRDQSQLAIQKFKWIPNGEAELQLDFGEDGYGMLVSAPNYYVVGVVTDGTYLYTADGNQVANTEPDADFFICDFEGTLLNEIDIRDWWSRPDEAALGKRMNSGPDIVTERNGKICLNCYCSCIKQLVDPQRYLENEEYQDLYLWSNLNGDYVMDQSFEATATVLWACNYPVSGFQYTMNADDNFFAFVSAYDHGAVSFGLFGPDGTGIGMLAYAGETGGFKKGEIFIDSGSPFDGIYCDNDQAGGSHWDGWVANEFTSGIFFIGHDSIKGVISSVVGVDESAPAAFSVEQNAPNPFNPTTTISFTLAEAGNISVEVYNVAGQKVDTIVNEFMDSGKHSIVWDSNGFSAGVYFYTVKSGDYSKTMKMTLIK